MDSVSNLFSTVYRVFLDTHSDNRIPRLILVYRFSVVPKRSIYKSFYDIRIKFSLILIFRFVRNPGVKGLPSFVRFNEWMVLTVYEVYGKTIPVPSTPFFFWRVSLLYFKTLCSYPLVVRP